MATSLTSTPHLPNRETVSLLWELPTLLPEKKRDQSVEISLIEAFIPLAISSQGWATVEKVTAIYYLIQSSLPRETIQREMQNPQSRIKAIVHLFHAFHWTETSDLTGLSKPVLIKGSILGRVCNLGIFKPVFRNDYYRCSSDGDGRVRERLNYVLTPEVVSPTFQIQLDGLGEGSFQLYLEGHQTLRDFRPYLWKSRFDSKSVRQIAFSQLQKLDVDLGDTNLMVHNTADEHTPYLMLKSIDGSYILPAELKGHRSNPLLDDQQFINHLLDPFTPREMALIDKIDLNETALLLRRHGIEESAIEINRCALLMLKTAAKWNTKKAVSERLNWRDLLAIAYISNPVGQDSNIGKLPAKETLFYEITQVKEKGDDQIISRIEETFSTIIGIRNDPKVPQSDPTRHELSNHYAVHPKKTRNWNSPTMGPKSVARELFPPDSPKTSTFYI